MSPQQCAVWRVLRDLGPSIVVDVARVAGIGRATAHTHLQALLSAGHVERRPLPGRGKCPYVYTATTQPRPTLRAVDAVRQVLADGPVEGLQEVARRAGYTASVVSIILQRVATIQRRRGPFRGGRTSIYRLREGA